MEIRARKNESHATLRKSNANNTASISYYANERQCAKHQIEHEYSKQTVTPLLSERDENDYS